MRYSSWWRARKLSEKAAIFGRGAAPWNMSVMPNLESSPTFASWTQKQACPCMPLATLCHCERAWSSGEAYIRSLAAGAHEGSATGDDALAQKSDIDKDGIADWWEQIYKIENEGGDDDADQDGLSNYSEYVISEAKRTRAVKPVAI